MEEKLFKLLGSVCISETMRKFRGKVMKGHAIFGFCGKWERKLNRIEIKSIFHGRKSVQNSNFGVLFGFQKQ